MNKATVVNVENESDVFLVTQAGTLMNCAPEYSTYLRKGYYYVNTDLEPPQREWMGPYDTASLARKFLNMERAYA